VYVINLEAENVKRLRAVKITPGKGPVIIGGRNAQGKSTALDSVAMAIGGKSLCPSEPLRRGTKKGKAIVDLSNGLHIERMFTPAGSRVEVVQGETGEILSSPQAILDALYGSLSFDPLAFVRCKPAEQLRQLLALMGIDTTDLDERRAQIYVDRTAVGRDRDRAKARADGMKLHPDTPEIEVDVSALQGELSARERANERYQALTEEWARLTERLAEISAELKGLGEEGPEALADLRGRLNEAVTVNRRVADNRAGIKARAEYMGLSDNYSEMTEQINEIDRAKAEMIAGAKLPMEGLTVDEACVRLNGIPLDQCSQSEKLRVSVAMAAAGAPELKVCLIRDGSVLDAEQLANVCAVAEEYGMQVWIERVGEGPECSVIIEDGEVKETREARNGTV
jgi:hypothetical protein